MVDGRGRAQGFLYPWDIQFVNVAELFDALQDILQFRSVQAVAFCAPRRSHKVNIFPETKCRTTDSKNARSLSDSKEAHIPRSRGAHGSAMAKAHALPGIGALREGSMEMWRV